MQELSGAQRRYLKSQAHHLKPVIRVGKSGLTDPLAESVVQALRAHELIKVKFTDLKDRKGQLTDELGARTESHVIAILGNTSTLYRQNADPERRKIQLPPK